MLCSGRACGRCISLEFTLTSNSQYKKVFSLAVLSNHCIYGTLSGSLIYGVGGIANYPNVPREKITHNSIVSTEIDRSTIQPLFSFFYKVLLLASWSGGWHLHDVISITV